MRAFFKWITESLYPERLRRFWHPTVALGVVLVALCWSVTVSKIDGDKENARNELISELASESVSREQEFLRTMFELDRIIKFLRRSFERNDYSADWPSLVSEEFTVNERTVQIAIIDETGKMITSSAQPYPTTPVDLSDREHFRVQKASTTDKLHVSSPVLGRVSKKWSIQFTRRFVDWTGAFSGVIVVSLDPEKLFSMPNRSDSTPMLGFGLIGDDGVVRAVGGQFPGKAADRFAPTAQARIGKSSSLTDDFEIFDINNVAYASTKRKVRDTNLSVVVTVPDTSAATGHEWQLYAFCCGFSGLVATAVASSVARQRRQMSHITRLAHQDSLTKLENRHAFRDCLFSSVNLRNQIPFVLHLVDLDRFKSVNDSFGHPVGDALLCAVADRIKAAVRKSDRVFRLGGDEFAVLQLGEADQNQAEIVAERLSKILGEPFSIGEHRLNIGASVGIAASGQGFESDSAILMAADLALYAAKSHGRGTFKKFAPEMMAASLHRKTLEADLRDAIRSNRIDIAYQPKVSLDTNETVGFEALVRWTHPTLGLVPPSDFIPIAEESDLIVELGDYVLNYVCRDCANRGNESIAVNISPVEFARGNLVTRVSKALQTSDFPPHRLEIEITESTLMSCDTSILDQLVGLRALGVRISLDDFGTGYSSLGYVARYPIDCIKIDRSFVGRLGNDPKALAITKAILALAHDLQMTTVAEGVETLAQQRILADLGCDIGQGYLFGRPQVRQRAAEPSMAN